VVDGGDGAGKQGVGYVEERVVRELRQKRENKRK
jgi:hypothetical protein